MTPPDLPWRPQRASIWPDQRGGEHAAGSSVRFESRPIRGVLPAWLARLPLLLMLRSTTLPKVCKRCGCRTKKV
jgi:hypothetical protein